ncbi:(2,3-dihydroxybenzoyl)adenylate synthase [Corynebacterium sp. 22KM0430]|uniref:(2,3-dihydroxybenzoyl)adenylate synthase n=1 Tax=unclassified Corynebacterium TaxID=2624378 RepID=UPI002B2E96AF|nr:AMP-binding protein [Corynebacterium sp. 22KM0430]WPF69724.1 AMP-binding protein [Corynebacterium sp. 21KM1197]
MVATGVPEDVAREYRAAGLWTGDHHWRMFTRTVRRYGDSRAVTDRYRSLTWVELAETAAQASAHLAALGVRRGDGVIVQMPNSVAFLETLLGIWRLGAIPVMTLPAHGSTEIAYFADTAPARHYVGPAKGDRHHARVIRDLEQGHPEVTRIAVDTRSADSPWGTHPIPEPVDVSPDELAFLQLSGGTTGTPKMIPKTHDDYLYSVRASLDVCDLGEGDTLLTVLPAAHNFSMSSPGILGAMMVGAHIVFAADPSPTTVLPLIEKHRVTHGALVPPMLLSYLNSSERPRHDLSSLRTLWVGGAKLSAAAARRVKPELGCQLQQVFGMAEGLVNYTRLDDAEEIVVTTQGRPASPWDEVRLIDAEGRDVPAGEPGELITRGPYTIRRYHRNPEANARSFTPEGFYRTGDIATRDAQGNITVVGRAKDQINRGGEKVAPEAVENALLGHPDVHDVSVVGIEDEVLGEKILAYVIPQEGRELSSLGLRKFARESGLSSFAVPDVVEIVAEFPYTGVGKVSKKQQRQR